MLGQLVRKATDLSLGPLSGKTIFSSTLDQSILQTTKTIPFRPAIALNPVQERLDVLQGDRRCSRSPA